MPVVTGTVAATTAAASSASAGAAVAASSASAGSSVAAGSASTGATVTAGSAHLSVADAAKQAEMIRKYASRFIKSAPVMTVVRESEIVDEFAAPIYAGLAALSTSGNSAAHQLPTAGPDVPLSGLPKVKGGLAVKENGLTALPVEKPETKALLENHYDRSTIKEQLAEGRDQIVVERNLREEKVVDTGDKRTAMCIIEERVIDRKYLEHGYLTDLISEVRHGNIPTIRQIYLAIIDLADLATFKVFRPLLANLKLEASKYRLRQLTADIEQKKLAPSIEDVDESRTLVDREVEKRSWWKTDHVTERIGHKDVVSAKRVEIATVNVKDCWTVGMDKDAVDGFMARRTELDKAFGDGQAIARLEKNLPPEAIAGINKYAMAWVKESLFTSTAEYTSDETFNRYGVDLGGFLGKRIETSDKKVTERVRTTISEYLSPSDEICLTDVNTNQQAMAKFATLQKTMSQAYDPVVVNSYVKPGEGVTFDDGWITYIPGGSIVNLGVKADLGCKLTGWDWFWAGVDVASIAVAVATFGTSTAMTSAGVAATKAMVKQTGKVALKNTGKMGLKAGKSAVGGMRGVKAGAKTGVKTIRGKVAIKNPSTAGAKAKPPVNISKSATTYKNTPKAGTWDGMPGDSVYHPEPKTVPANPQANPKCKTYTQILRENNMPNGVPYVKGHPDFRAAARATVEVPMIADRSVNMAKADSLLAQQVRNGKATVEIEECLQKMGVDVKNVTKGDISRMRKQFGLTWHEHQDMKTMQLLSKELHGSIPHSGGIAALKQEARDAAEAVARVAPESSVSPISAPSKTVTSTSPPPVSVNS